MPHGRATINIVAAPAAIRRLAVKQQRGLLYPARAFEDSGKFKPPPHAVAASSR